MVVMMVATEATVVQLVVLGESTMEWTELEGMAAVAVVAGVERVTALHRSNTTPSTTTQLASPKPLRHEIGASIAPVVQQRSHAKNTAFGSDPNLAAGHR